MEIAKNFTQSLRKTIKITCFLETCVFPQNFPPDSQKADLTNVPEKFIETVNVSGSNSKKEWKLITKSEKKLIERTSGDVWGSF